MNRAEQGELEKVLRHPVVPVNSQFFLCGNSDNNFEQPAHQTLALIACLQGGNTLDPDGGGTGSPNFGLSCEQKTTLISSTLYTLSS